MKTNFRKEIDDMQEDFNIDEATILEDLDIDTEKIISTVMNSIQSAPVRKKHRKLPLILIAAALSAAVIGTTVLATTGVFTPFSQKFGGDTSALTVYENGTFHFHSDDDNLQASFSGLVGDDTFTLAAVELTKKDGSTFTGDDGILSAKTPLSSKGYTYLIDRPQDLEPYGETRYYTDGVDYYLSKDKKTLTLYMTIETPNDHVEGTKVSFSSEKIYTYKLGEKEDEFFTVKNSMMSDVFDTDNSTVMKYKSGKYFVYHMETTPVSLPLEISFELDKKLDTGMKIDLTSQNVATLVKPDQTIEMDISPFGINLKSEKVFSDQEISTAIAALIEKGGYLNPDDMYTNLLSPFVLNEDDGYQQKHIDLAHSGILMKDGTEYFFTEIDNQTRCDYLEDNAIRMNYQGTLLFSEYPFDPDLSNVSVEDLHTNVLDPSKIAKIMINNHIVYTAADSEDKKFDMIASPLLHQWTAKDLHDLLNDNYSQLGFINFTSQIGVPDETLGCYATDISVGFYGHMSDLLYDIHKIVEERENGLFIMGMNVFPKGEDKFEVELIMKNLYVLDSGTLSSDILKKVSNENWQKIAEDYMGSRILPDSQVSFNISDKSIFNENEAPDFEALDAFSETPVRQPMTEPVSEPERTSPITSDLSKLRLNTWTTEDLQKLITPETKDFLSLDEHSVNSENDENQNRVFTIKLKRAVTQSDVYNLVNALTKYEEDNLFVSSIEMTGIEENNGTYIVFIKLINPAVTDTNSDQIKASIINDYGHTDRVKALEALYHEIKEIETEKMTVDYLSSNSGWCVKVRLQSVFRKDGFSSFLEFKEKVNSRKNYTMSQSLEVWKVDGGFRANNLLYSFNYRK